MTFFFGAFFLVLLFLTAVFLVVFYFLELTLRAAFLFSNFLSLTTSILFGLSSFLG